MCDVPERSGTDQRPTVRNLFIASAVVILFLTAVAKLVSGWGAAPVLEVRDPLLL